MRVGVLSDIHGNKVALEAVLSAMPSVDQLVCAGDVVGYNPWHADCVERLRERDAPTVQGNHDRAVAGEAPHRFTAMASAGVDHATNQLSQAQLDWLDALPTHRTVADGQVALVHGHPDDPNRYTRPHQFHAGLLGDESVLVIGHTHIQHHEVYDDGIVLNPGSVGQPRDEDPRAAFAVVDLAAMTVTEHRVDYDTDAVIEAIDAAGLPREIGFRLTQGR
jgi:putative phosphoesterase